MSLYSAMLAGVSGLNAYSSAMGAISDNIANVNTVGYKRSQSDFSALINSQPAGTSGYNAGGVTATSRRIVDLQGALTQSRSSTDLAINGNGFFIVSEDPNETGAVGAYFTRAGAFSLNEDGLLVNAQGYYLMGAPIDPDQPTANATPSTLAALAPIDLSSVGSDAVATSALAINANLDASQTPQTGILPWATGAMWAAPTAAGYVVPDLERTVEVFDSLGAVQTINFAFKKLDTAASTWRVEVFLRPDPTAAGIPISSAEMDFNTDGTLNAINTPAGGFPAAAAGAPLTSITIDWPTLGTPAGSLTGASAQTISVDLLSGVTQYSATSQFKSATADGSPPGELSGVVISADGILSAQFSNGRTAALYQVPVATFLNPNGLTSHQGGAYRQSLDSGLLTINTPGLGRAGSIQANTLEASNVDLGTEFTSLITTQRAYSASSRIITTADEMLEELLRIKR